MATEWNKLVKKTYSLGKLQDPAYTLSQAMKNAKKVYHNGSNMVESVKKRLSFKNKKGGRKTKRRRSKK
jgi:hypothetical protein